MLRVWKEGVYILIVLVIFFNIMYHFGTGGYEYALYAMCLPALIIFGNFDHLHKAMTCALLVGLSATLTKTNSHGYLHYLFATTSMISFYLAVRYALTAARSDLVSALSVYQGFTLENLCVAYVSLIASIGVSSLLLNEGYVEWGSGIMLSLIVLYIILSWFKRHDNMSVTS